MKERSLLIEFRSSNAHRCTVSALAGCLDELPSDPRPRTRSKSLLLAPSLHTASPTVNTSQKTRLYCIGISLNAFISHAHVVEYNRKLKAPARFLYFLDAPNAVRFFVVCPSFSLSSVSCWSSSFFFLESLLPAPPAALGVEPEKDAETGVGAADPGVDPGVVDSCKTA